MKKAPKNEVKKVPHTKYEYSFIVPVYNKEKYISECIESILKQGERCELILIDDGSKDLSGGICDIYAKKYERVRVYHKENKGPAAARNFGCEMADGRYCIFVDADDYISENFIKQLDEGAADHGADIIFYTIIKILPDGTKRPMAEGLKREKIYGKPANEVLKAISECSKFPASSGGKIIQTEFLRSNNIRFREGFIGEDIDWTLQLVSVMKSADVYEDGIYYYRISENTRRSYGNEKSLDDQLKIIEKWLNKSLHSESKKHILAFLAFQYAIVLPFYGALPSKIRNKYKERIKALRFLLEKGKTSKIRLIRTAVCLLGPDNASRLLYKYVIRRDGTDA